MSPIRLDDDADPYDVFLETFLRTTYGDRYGAVEADKVTHALDAAGLRELVVRATSCHVYEFKVGRSICVKCGAERTAVIDF